MIDDRRSSFIHSRVVAPPPPRPGRATRPFARSRRVASRRVASRRARTKARGTSRRRVSRSSSRRNQSFYPSPKMRSRPRPRRRRKPTRRGKRRVSSSFFSRTRAVDDETRSRRSRAGECDLASNAIDKWFETPNVARRGAGSKKVKGALGAARATVSVASNDYIKG